MRVVLCFLGLAFFCATTLAQDGPGPGPKIIHVPRSAPSGPALVQTVPQGSYCEAGSDAVAQFAISGQITSPDTRHIYQRCAPGDTVSFSARLAVFAALVCDFSKSIILTPSTAGSQIVCVISPERGVRTNRR